MKKYKRELACFLVGTLLGGLFGGIIMYGTSNVSSEDSVDGFKLSIKTTCIMEKRYVVAATAVGGIAITQVLPPEECIR